MNGVEQLIAFMWGTLMLLLGWVFCVVHADKNDDAED